MNFGVCIKKKRSSSTTTTSIDRLTGDLLLDILCKLPCYGTAVRCKTVSKCWRSLIFSRLFDSHAFTMHRDIEDNKPQSCALLLNMTMWDGNSVTSMVVPPRYQRILSLQFLPYPTKIVATFKDLVLCFGVDPWSELGLYYVCNPITKQWTALPPYERDQESLIRPSPDDQLDLIRLNLLCQKGDDFRVVIIHSFTATDLPLFVTVNSSIYLSETGKWKNVDIKIEQYQTIYKGLFFGNRDLRGVVCKQTVCLRVGCWFFGAFNPFDVTDTFSGTLTAIPLPLKPRRGQSSLSECDGKLIALEHLRIYSDGEVCIAYFLSRKLELNIDNKQPGSLKWEPMSEVYDKVEVHGTVLTPPAPGSHNEWYKVIGVHPKKEHLIYFITPTTKDKMQLVTLNTKLKTLEFSTRLLHHEFSGLNRLYMPNWPTPIRQSIAVSKNKNNS